MKPPMRHSRNRTGPLLKIRIIPLLGILVFAVLVLDGCAKKNFQELDIDHLNGKIIGVMNGYSSDYILSQKFKDVKLRRFDDYSNMALALTFHQLDAAAMEMDEAHVFCRLQPSYMIYGTFAKGDQFAYMLSPGNTDLQNRFNAFVREFKKTDLYQEMLKRVDACDKAPFKSKPAQNIHKGKKVLRALVFADWEPVSYKNTKTNQWEGVDVELITLFADSMEARIEFVPVGSYTQAVLDLRLGKVDIFVCPNTLRQKKDLEKAGHVRMSDGIWEKDIVIIVNSADYPKNNKARRAS
jgi:ABC-type amino acid transport substrate-binding protein